MASIKDLKKRIGTVKNTQQTTRAMKMVSAAKLRRAQEAIQNHRPYAKRMGELIERVSGLAENPVESPLMRKKNEGEKKKLLLVLVTSDRGLCGGFNSNVIKNAQRWIASHRDQYESIQLGYVGRRGFDFFKTRVGADARSPVLANVAMGPYFQELGGKVTFAKATELSRELIAKFSTEEVDEVKIVYNQFKNAVTQILMVEDFLPLVPAQEPAGDSKKGEVESGVYLVRPNTEEVFQALLERNFPVQAFRIMLESQASEHGARMSSMENATKNAGEMIRKLTLQFNKQRQAGITKELLEIISGSESQKNSA